MRTVTARNRISLHDLRGLAAARFGELVKAGLEFDSMTNLRPSFGNRSRGVDDPAIRDRIADLLRGLVVR
jgi:hypothetical protein